MKTNYDKRLIEKQNVEKQVVELTLCVANLKDELSNLESSKPTQSSSMKENLDLKQQVADNLSEIIKLRKEIQEKNERIKKPDSIKVTNEQCVCLKKIQVNSSTVETFS